MGSLWRYDREVLGSTVLWLRLFPLMLRLYQQKLEQHEAKTPKVHRQEERPTHSVTQRRVQYDEPQVAQKMLVKLGSCCLQMAQEQTYMLLGSLQQCHKRSIAKFCLSLQDNDELFQMACLLCQFG